MTAEAINFTPTPAPPPEAPRQDVRYVTTPTLESQLAVLGMTLGPEPTPTPAPVETPDEPDPYRETDQANVRAIESPTNNEEFGLQNPLIIAVAKLDIRLAPDLTFVVLGGSDGPFGLAYNASCIVDQLEDEDVLGDRLTQDLPQRDGLFSSGPGSVRSVQVWPVGVRVESVEATVLANEVPLTINGQDFRLPILTARGVTFNGQYTDCPTVGERFSGQIGQVLSGVDAAAIGETLGSVLGDAFSGFQEGFGEGRSN